MASASELMHASPEWLFVKCNRLCVRTCLHWRAHTASKACRGSWLSCCPYTRCHIRWSREHL